MFVHFNCFLFLHSRNTTKERSQQDTWKFQEIFAFSCLLARYGAIASPRSLQNKILKSLEIAFEMVKRWKNRLQLLSGMTSSNAIQFCFMIDDNDQTCQHFSRLKQFFFAVHERQRITKNMQSHRNILATAHSMYLVQNNRNKRGYEKE